MRLLCSQAFLLLLFLSSCSVIRQNPKYTFSDGTYISNAFGKDAQKVYVDYEEEEIHVYPLQKATSGYTVDTTAQQPVVFSETGNNQEDASFSFRQNSFDIDFLTIPFKYRFRLSDMPRQFTSSLSGGLYLGYRTDIYLLHYAANLLGKSSRHITHTGFSFGGFTGIGGTAMNPWVTGDQLQIEYEGIIWSKGVAGIVGLNHFTVGLALGWDHLLDRNRRDWIYQQKPWLGFVFGLNLN
jgi:hypothetical protein